MLGTIIVHEIQEYIKSKKFLIGLFVIIVLVTLSTVINIEDFQRRNQDYHTALQLRQTGIIKVYRPPQVLSIFSQGKEKLLGTTVTLTFGTIRTTTTGYMGLMFGKDNRLNAGFSAVDFIFLVKIVLSLIVIFFAYNSISGEKERGTLKLALANRLPRDKVLLGKFIGGMTVIVFSLTTAMVVSLLIVVFHPAISLGFSGWMRILCMFVVSALYLTVFFTLSLIVSVKANRPSTALMVLLQVWLFLTIIYPNTAVIITKKWYKLPSEKEILERKREATKEYRELTKKYFDMIKSGKDRGDIYKKRQEMQGNEVAVTYYKVEREFCNELKSQAEFAQNIALLSPSVIYDKIMIRLAKTGTAEFDKFLDALLPYYRILIKSEIFFNEDAETKIPVFDYSSEKVAESLYESAFDVFYLFLFGTLFFAMSYVVFLRKDVR